MTENEIEICYATSNLDTSPIQKPIPMAKKAYVISRNASLGDTNITYEIQDGFITLEGELGGNSYRVICASSTNGSIVHKKKTDPDGSVLESDIVINSSYSYGGKTVYRHEESYYHGAFSNVTIHPCAGEQSAYGVNNIAWTMIYGDITCPQTCYATSDLDVSPLTQPLPYAEKAVCKRETTDQFHRNLVVTTTYHSVGLLYGAIGGRSYAYLVASATQADNILVETYYEVKETGEIIDYRTNTTTASSSYTYNGKTVYYGMGTSAYVDARQTVLEPLADADFYNYRQHIGEIAWTLIYGDVECEEPPVPPEPCEDKEVIPYVCGHESTHIVGCSLCPPVRIKITVPPTKLHYTVGEQIDLSGIVVRAFKANGNLWDGFRHGIIPISQLTHEPQVANGVDISPIIRPVEYDTSGTVISTGQQLEHYYAFSEGSGQYTTVLNTLTKAIHLWASDDPNAVASDRYYETDTHQESTTYFNLTSSYTYLDKTVYYRGLNGALWQSSITYAEPCCNNGNVINEPYSESWGAKVAWMMVFGDLQEVIVSWVRSDGAVLSDSFGIKIGG